MAVLDRVVEIDGVTYTLEDGNIHLTGHGGDIILTPRTLGQVFSKMGLTPADWFAGQ